MAKKLKWEIPKLVQIGKKKGDVVALICQNGSGGGGGCDTGNGASGCFSFGVSVTSSCAVGNDPL